MIVRIRVLNGETVEICGEVRDHRKLTQGRRTKTNRVTGELKHYVIQNGRVRLRAVPKNERSHTVQTKHFGLYIVKPKIRIVVEAAMRGRRGGTELNERVEIRVRGNSVLVSRVRRIIREHRVKIMTIKVVGQRTRLTVMRVPHEKVLVQTANRTSSEQD